MSALSCLLTGHRWGPWEYNRSAWNLLSGWHKVDVRWCERCRANQVLG